MYRLMAKLHWTPRERSIERLLTMQMQNQPGCIRRMVDIGCGPGWLVRTARRLGIDYLGADPAHHGDCDIAGGRIEQRDALNTIEELKDSDVVILNGVVHHLDDLTLEKVLCSSKKCAATIICDHRAEPSNHLVNRILQRLDRGRFIRPWDYFQSLTGYASQMLEPFEIRWFGIPIWSYFAGLYLPKDVSDG
ncbi:MAG: class I SAM-dependent methyltransferase [Phycisphaerales bacterium]|nr:class I SAM-dependent methyltransferase [Phycisphaerales bacterium]